MKNASRITTFVALVGLVAAAACSSSSGGSSSSSSSGGSSSGGSSSGGSSSGGSSSGGSSSGGSSSGGSSSGGSSSGGSSSGGSSSGGSSSGGSSSGDGGTDGSAEQAHCGQPGDTGNSLGVGKYCTGIPDCLGNPKATLCSTLGGPGTNFCTMQCTNPDGGTECGENATCQCSGNQCGCTPNYCL